MVRQRTSLTKQAAAPGSPEKQKRKQGTPTETKVSSLNKTLRARDDGKNTHLHARNTTDNYTGHVRRAREWLQHNLEEHVADEGTASGETTLEPNSAEDFYNDPLSKDAFGRIPNVRSSEALSLYLAWRGFQTEKVSPSTVEGIRAALKWHWDNA